MREDLAMGRTPHRVVVVALAGVYPFELSIPARLFGCARDEDGRPLYEVVTCSVDGGPVPTAADFAVAVTCDLSALRRAGTVIVPPRLEPSAPDAAGERLTAALRALPRGTRLASFCTAADILARAGLLDGRGATTHWRHVDDFRRRYPQVRVDGDALYVDDGDVLTAAGAASGVDLCLHLIRRDHGARVANAVARDCVVPPHRLGGQAQYVEQPVPATPAASTAATRAWALDRLDEDLTLGRLANHASMSVRTFSRRFVAEVGVSPSRWLSQQRVDRARLLLESTELSVERVAERVGLGTAASLRLHMNATVGVPPSAYRRTFGPRSPTRPAAGRTGALVGSEPPG
jgi:transcriptional regulator GlxA family with amidase domain